MYSGRGRVRGGDGRIGRVGRVWEWGAGLGAPRATDRNYWTRTAKKQFCSQLQAGLVGRPPDHRRLFDDRADALLKELVRIVFRQNMKSMETYYRWLAIQYAAQCGRIHPELLDTLFRYNSRSCMGGFVARLEALRGRAEIGKAESRNPKARAFLFLLSQFQRCHHH